MFSIIAGLVAGAFILYAVKGSAMTSTAAVSDDVFSKWGNAYGVDPNLLKAIAMRESSLNPNAVNSADHYSVGLMQILYRPSDPYDLDSPPSNVFDVDGWNEASYDKLRDPDFNVKIGAQILAYNIRTFGLPRAIAVYNSWDQRSAPRDGPFKNQDYVDAVLSNYQSLTA